MILLILIGAVILLGILLLIAIIAIIKLKADGKEIDDAAVARANSNQTLERRQ